MNPAPPPPLPVRVCPRHGLVAGRDGRCVICHRDDAGRAEERGNAQILGWTVGITVLVVGLFAYRSVRQMTAAPPPVAASETPAAAPPPPPPEDPDPEPATGPARRAARRAADEKDRQEEIEADMHHVGVKMFMIKKCEMCDAARTYMKDKGMAYQEVDVDGPGGLDALRKLTPSKQVPVFDVDGEVLVGFAPTLLTAAVRRAAERRHPRMY